MGFEPRTSSRKRTDEAANRGRVAWIRADSKICILLSASWGEGIKLRRLKPLQLEFLLTWQVDRRSPGLYFLVPSDLFYQNIFIYFFNVELLALWVRSRFWLLFSSWPWTTRRRSQSFHSITLFALFSKPQSGGRPCRCVYLYVHSESRLKKNWTNIQYC